MSKGLICKVYDLQKSIEEFPIHIFGKVSYRVISIFLRRILPMYYKYSIRKEKNLNDANNNVHEKIIISLTTFPERVSQIGTVLESLFNQTLKADKIILWLAEEQFLNKKDIEKVFERFFERGLIIKYCDDLKSHKKYFYALQEYVESLVITVDDDLFYPEDMVEKLYKVHTEHEDCIVCMRAHKMEFANGELQPYSVWSTGAKGVTGPDRNLFFTSGGGTLFPKHCFSKRCFDEEAIKEFCFYADDVWLNCMRILDGRQTVKVDQKYPEYISVKNAKKTGLAKMNVEQNQNDIQFKNVIERYNIKFV